MIINNNQINYFNNDVLINNSHQYVHNGPNGPYGHNGH